VVAADEAEIDLAFGTVFNAADYASACIARSRQINYKLK
jgi:hypothetical protein